MNIEHFSTTCEDGVSLQGELFIPERPRAVVQFSCGTATPTKVYRHFLSHIAQAGFICALWDYRGSEIYQENLSQCQYQYADYGRQDMPAVKQYLRQRFPELPLVLLGHSAGGQQFGFMPDYSGVVGAISIGASSGYTGNMPLSYRLKAYWYFYAFMPASIAWRGYVATKSLGIMEDLPTGVATQWRDWCSKPDYFFDPQFRGQTLPADLFCDIHFPIQVYYASDDTIATPQNIDNFWRHVHSSAGVEIQQLDAKELKVKRIDHFGYFSRALKSQFWPQIIADINRFLD